MNGLMKIFEKRFGKKKDNDTQKGLRSRVQELRSKLPRKVVTKTWTRLSNADEPDLGIIVMLGLGIFFTVMVCLLLPMDRMLIWPWTFIGTIMVAPLMFLIWYWRHQNRCKEIHQGSTRIYDERFRNAVTHLADDKETIRMGGIHELVSLAEADEEQYLSIVSGMLESFVRTRSVELQEERKIKETKVAGKEEKQKTEDTITEEAEEEKPIGEKIDLPEDLILAFNISRELNEKMTRDGVVVNISLVKMISFDGICFKYVKFPLCERLSLKNVEMNNAILIKSELRGVNLDCARLEGARLEGANLEGAELNYAELNYAELEKAKLFCAKLKGAKLEGAELKGANLEGAELNFAELGYARLRGVKLIGARLRGAKLADAEELTQEQIDWAIGNDETEIPEELRRPDHWGLPEEEQRKIIQQKIDEIEKNKAEENPEE